MGLVHIKKIGQRTDQDPLKTITASEQKKSMDRLSRLPVNIRVPTRRDQQNERKDRIQDILTKKTGKSRKKKLKSSNSFTATNNNVAGCANGNLPPVYRSSSESTLLDKQHHGTMHRSHSHDKAIKSDHLDNDHFTQQGFKHDQKLLELRDLQEKDYFDVPKYRVKPEFLRNHS
jgi:hypothetical protein